MKNKQVKQMMYDVYRLVYSKYTDNYDKFKNDWAFDRLRSYEQPNRKQLRYPCISKVSLTTNQLKGIE